MSNFLPAKALKPTKRRSAHQASLYDLTKVRASKTSASRQILARRGISSPFKSPWITATVPVLAVSGGDLASRPDQRTAHVKKAVHRYCAVTAVVNNSSLGSAGNPITLAITTAIVPMHMIRMPVSLSRHSDAEPLAPLDMRLNPRQLAKLQLAWGPAGESGC